MHTVAEVVRYLASPSVAIVNALAPILASAAGRPVKGSDFLVASFAVSTAFIGMFCVWWALWTHARFSNYRVAARREASLLRGFVRFRDALLNTDRRAIVILGADRKAPLHFGATNDLLQKCMSGPNATPLANALDGLLKNGRSFQLRAPAAGQGVVEIEGKAVGRYAAIFLNKVGKPDEVVDFRSVLDALPIAVWLRNKNGGLGWANGAFLAAVRAASLADAQRSGAMLDRTERDLIVSVRDGAEVSNVRRYAGSGDQRRAISLNLAKLADGSILGSAQDITDAVRTEAVLRANAASYAQVLNRVPIAIAEFGSDKRLKCYNSAYAQMWCLPEAWLDTHPGASEILDRLRDAARLPEKSDFTAWKREQLKTFDQTNRYVDDTWHLPGGKSVHVEAQPDLDGGVCFLFSDISERIALIGKLTLLTEVQRATLDTLEDGVAVFGADGKLAINNHRFAKMWNLSHEETLSSPHFTQLAKLGHARHGHDVIWDIIAAGISSSEPERYGDWGKVTRTDGRIVSTCFSRLPNGATVVTIKDFTDLERFSEVLGERAHAAA